MNLTAAAYLMDGVAEALAFLPKGARFAIASLIGRGYALFAKSQRRALQINSQRLLGYTQQQSRRYAHQVLRNFAITLGDFFNPQDVRVRVDDKVELEALHKKHGGLLFLTFHMGHWEMGARVMRSWGWPVTAVYQPYRNRKFKEVIEKRRAPGVNFIPVGQGAAQGVRAALKRGEVVAMLGDHPFGEEGMPATILGQRAIWPKGPILLAVREKTPIVIAVIVREKPHQYAARVFPPLIPRNATRGEVQRLVQEVADKFGMLLADFPTQWYRFREMEFLKSK